MTIGHRTEVDLGELRCSVCGSSTALCVVIAEIPMKYELVDVHEWSCARCSTDLVAAFKVSAEEAQRRWTSTAEGEV